MNNVKSKKTLLIVIIALVLVVTLVGALLLTAGLGAVLLLKKNNDAGSEEPVSGTPVKSPLVLSADKTRFRIGKGEAVELTVVSNVEQTGAVTDEDGEVLLTLQLKEGQASGSIDVFEEDPRCISLTASMGEAESQSLELYIAPEVTEKMIVTGILVAAELGDALIKQGFESVDKKALKAARKWLEADERVEATLMTDNGVFYYTTDGITGACLLTPEEGVLGSTAFDEKENVTLQTYEKWNTGDLTEYQYIFSDNTVTNGKILTLNPLYGEDKAWWEDNDPAFHNDTNSDTAKKIADALGYLEPDIRRDNHVLEAVSEGKLNEYGIVMLNTHATMFGTDDMSKEEKLWCYILKDSNAFRNLDGDFDALARYVNEVLHVEGQDYSRYYTKYSTDALENLKTSQMFIAVDMGVDEALEEEKEDTAGDGEQVKGNIQIFGTSNLIRDMYQNKKFDNSIIYLGACYSMTNMELAQFLIDHGAVACMGYINEVTKGVEASTCKAVFGDMLSWSKEKVHLKNIQEVAETTSPLLNVMRNAMEGINWELNRFLKWVDALPNMSVEGSYETNQFNFAIYAEPVDYTLYGSGTLHGTALRERDGEPVEGATVELYHWMDQEFLPEKTAVTGEDGSFYISKLPWGVYVVKITTETGGEGYASCIFADESYDAGFIHVEEKLPLYYEYIRDELVPVYGLIEQGDTEKKSVGLDGQGWDERAGILSAAIRDMNGDDVEDMVLLRVAREKGKIGMLQTLYADMYTIEKNEIVLKNTVQLGDFTNAEINRLWVAMYRTSKGYDLYVQSYSEQVLTSGIDPIYTRWRFDDEGLRKIFSIEQTGGGSSDMVYTVMEYDYGCNKERAKKLSIEDIFEKPSNGYRDVPTMYCHFVEQNLESLIEDYWNDYPSFVGDPEFEPVAEFFSNAVHVGARSGDFTMQISDYTDLPAELEKLEP